MLLGHSLCHDPCVREASMRNNQAQMITATITKTIMQNYCLNQPQIIHFGQKLCT